MVLGRHGDIPCAARCSVPASVSARSPWLSRTSRPHHPDRLVFDLDPGGEDFSPVRQAARDLRQVLEDLGLAPYLMTTGSRGLHLWVPLDRKTPYDRVRAFAQDAAELLARRHPERLTTARQVEDRGGRLFLDTARNAYAQTAVCPYAVRARPGAPVATPLDWEELDDADLSPTRYTMENLRRRLGQKEDPWRGFLQEARALRDARQKLDELTEGS